VTEARRRDVDDARRRQHERHAAVIARTSPARARAKATQSAVTIAGFLVVLANITLVALGAPWFVATIIGALGLGVLTTLIVRGIRAQVRDAR
jgi:hypothetical protein